MSVRSIRANLAEVRRHSRRVFAGNKYMEAYAAQIQKNIGSLKLRK